MGSCPDSSRFQTPVREILDSFNWQINQTHNSPKPSPSPTNRATEPVSVTTLPQWHAERVSSPQTENCLYFYYLRKSQRELLIQRKSRIHLLSEWPGINLKVLILKVASRHIYRFTVLKKYKRLNFYPVAHYVWFKKDSRHNIVKNIYFDTIYDK